jgi:aspartyl-tRNA(Asn)/glutamyl-tRNA(Gln) amidotransferase subunit B
MESLTEHAKEGVSRYEMVVGLEIHVQLKTETKLFCADANSFGAGPNTHVSPITLGHPGTLPMINRKAVEYAVRMGLVCGCDIDGYNYFARKNYFYPDLPKGYQVSQHTTPICRNGQVTVQAGGKERKIPLTRIHMEEDAGKSIHDIDPEVTCLDYNRAGVPLIEIVTEPAIRSSEEAFAFLSEVRKLVRWIGICDGNMEEGSLRCDANISVRPWGATELGTKVEVKNLNSIRNIRRAIDAEAARLMLMMDRRETILQETRSYDADSNTTFSIRTKEDADDYRYFPEPDLNPFVLTPEWISEVRSGLPQLPEMRMERYRNEFGLPDYDARVLCEDRALSDYFEHITGETKQYKSTANFLMGPVRSWLNERELEWEAVKLDARTWRSLISLVEEGKLTFSVAAQKLLPLLLEGRQDDPGQLARELNILQDADAGSVEQWVDEVMARMPDKVQEYRKGKKGLIGLFVGEVKKASRGKADPKLTNELLLAKLNPS